MPDWKSGIKGEAFAYKDLCDETRPRKNQGIAIHSEDRKCGAPT
jgi:hypothetical protein